MGEIIVVIVVVIAAGPESTGQYESEQDTYAGQAE